MPTLVYFEDDSLKKKLDTVDLSILSVFASSKLRDKSKPFGIRIQIPNRELFLNAESEDDQIYTMAFIRALVVHHAEKGDNIVEDEGECSNVNRLREIRKIFTDLESEEKILETLEVRLELLIKEEEEKYMPLKRAQERLTELSEILSSLTQEEQELELQEKKLLVLIKEEEIQKRPEIEAAETKRIANSKEHLDYANQQEIDAAEAKCILDATCASDSTGQIPQNNPRTAKPQVTYNSVKQRMLANDADEDMCDPELAVDNDKQMDACIHECNVGACAIM